MDARFKQWRLQICLYFGDGVPLQTCHDKGNNSIILKHSSIILQLHLKDIPKQNPYLCVKYHEMLTEEPISSKDEIVC